MILDTLPAVKNLSAREKWRLAEELWNELLPETTPSQDDAVHQLIESRMMDYRQNPGSSASLTSVKERLHSYRHG